VINLATMLGMPANLAKDAISLNPKKVLLNARKLRAPRNTHRADV
jgi:ribonuclease P/MRP protein subunit RPP1